jgi:hypothetical protein
MHHRTIAGLVSFALLLASCSSVGSLQCPTGQQAAVSESLYFGTAKPVGVVRQEEWSAFLSGVVTPRFPAGLTVWPASGQWQSADGAITRETSFVLNLIHPADDASERAVGAIVAEYKSRFRQEAVLRVKVHACTSL